MAQQTIDHGFVEGDGQGESPFTGMQKANANFSELYTEKDSAIAALALKAPLANPSFTGTVSGISKSMVGLTNADNTSDTSKPVSTAQSAAIIAGDNLRLQTSDISHDFVASGLTMVNPTNSLSGTLTAGVAYVNGIRTVKSADIFTYLATRDTYLDMDTAGVLYRAEAVNAVPNGAAAPSLVAGRIRLMKIVTSATDITSITQLSSFGAGLVLRYSNKASFPATGDIDLLYVDTATNISWRWNGAAYQALGMNAAGNGFADPNGGVTIPLGGVPLTLGADLPALTALAGKSTTSLYMAQDTNIIYSFDGTNLDPQTFERDASGNIDAQVNHRTSTLSSLLALTNAGDGEIAVPTDSPGNLVVFTGTAPSVGRTVRSDKYLGRYLVKLSAGVTSYVSDTDIVFNVVSYDDFAALFTLSGGIITIPAGVLTTLGASKIKLSHMIEMPYGASFLGTYRKSNLSSAVVYTTTAGYQLNQIGFHVGSQALFLALQTAIMLIPSPTLQHTFGMTVTHDASVAPTISARSWLCLELYA